MALLLTLLVSGSAVAATEKRISEEEKPARVAQELAVTIDVKDAEAGQILRSMARQCRVRNLAIDAAVQGKGTFYFQDVPCRTAFPIVLRSLGLDAVFYPNVIAVGTRPR
ncbi:MAG TPA: hypothetical protein VMS98_17630 [Thermoanaerobaculia bacterium]|nr:hypothetical protein [Thermoanaerobaculia bacterium]